MTGCDRTRHPIGWTADEPGIRREPRHETVRVVEYTRFPRLSPDAEPSLGFTRDLSRTGLCIGADRGEEVGALLRLSVRDFAGRNGEPVVARVVWTQEARDERHWIGLALLANAERERNT
jgi:hypothetical protein